VTDRGPNLFVSQAVDDYGLAHLEALRGGDAKIMPMPDKGAEIVELAIEGDAVRMVKRMPLRTASGQRLSGAALPGGEMEPLYDMQGRPLPPSALGADTEAIAAMPQGGFFVAEEYGPSLLKVDDTGVVTERWVPAGREEELAHPEIVVRGVLPAKAAHRRANRGFEALCTPPQGRTLYVGLQSGLEGGDERSAPIWKLDAKTGEVLAEFAYPFDEPASFRRDAARRKLGWKDLKICEFFGGFEDRLFVLERVSHTSKIHVVKLGASPKKELVFSSDDHPEIGPDIEGMTLLQSGQILICSDNDFGVEGAETGFWRITLG
jgi:hypothetical protein